MRLEEGKPELVRFKGENGDITSIPFQSGASVKHGSEVSLAPEDKAVYSSMFSVNDWGLLAECRVKAYIWDAELKLFVFDERAGKGAESMYCARVEDEHTLSEAEMRTLPYEGKLAHCRAIPNGSTNNLKETSRLFINLPKDVYTDKDHNLQFTTARGNATAGWVSNGGPYGEAMDVRPGCWSYYYDFEGSGEVDLKVKSAVKNVPAYFVRFIVGPS